MAKNVGMIASSLFDFIDTPLLWMNEQYERNLFGERLVRPIS
jgi:hypothetical protein